MYILYSIYYYHDENIKKKKKIGWNNYVDDDI